MSNIHTASLGTQAKAEISDTRAVSATLGIGGERSAVRRWIISATLRCHHGSAPLGTTCMRTQTDSSRHSVTTAQATSLVHVSRVQTGCDAMMIRGAAMGLECCTTGVAAISWVNTLQLRTEKSPASGRSASAWREFSARGGRHRALQRRRINAESRAMPSCAKDRGVKALQTRLKGVSPLPQNVMN